MPISGSYTANDAISFADCYVQVDLTPASPAWADIDSWSTDIAFSGEQIPTNSAYPFKGSAIVFTGVKGPAQIVCTVVYTEGTADPFYNIRTLFESGDNNPMDIRWQPDGSGTGKLLFTSSGGKLVACPPPTGSGDASSANVVQFTIEADSVGMTISS